MKLQVESNKNGKEKRRTEMMMMMMREGGEELVTGEGMKLDEEPTWFVTKLKQVQ